MDISEKEKELESIVEDSTQKMEEVLENKSGAIFHIGNREGICLVKSISTYKDKKYKYFNWNIFFVTQEKNKIWKTKYLPGNVNKKIISRLMEFGDYEEFSKIDRYMKKLHEIRKQANSALKKIKGAIAVAPKYETLEKIIEENEGVNNEE